MSIYCKDWVSLCFHRPAVLKTVMAAYGQTQYSPALQPTGPYTPYTHHTQGYSMTSYSECSLHKHPKYHSWFDYWAYLFLSHDQTLKQKTVWVIRQVRAVCWDTRRTSAGRHPVRHCTATPHTVSVTAASYLYGISELGLVYYLVFEWFFQKCVHYSSKIWGW